MIVKPLVLRTNGLRPPTTLEDEQSMDFIKGNKLINEEEVLAGSKQEEGMMKF